MNHDPVFIQPQITSRYEVSNYPQENSKHYTGYSNVKKSAPTSTKSKDTPNENLRSLFTSIPSITKSVSTKKLNEGSHKTSLANTRQGDELQMISTPKYLYPQLISNRNSPTGKMKVTVAQ